MFNAVVGYFADQGLPLDFAADAQFSATRHKLFYLTAFNKSGATLYIELYDAASSAAATGVLPRILPCPAGNLVYWAQLLMRNGAYAKAVSAVVTGVGGGTKIATSDVKYDCGYMDE